MVQVRLSLCIALLAAVPPPAATLGVGIAGSTPHRPAVSAIEGNYAEELQRFSKLLGRLRAGGENVSTQLQSSAERLCEQWGRCDAGDVARYYVSLSSAERARGLLDEARYQSLRDEVYESGESGLEGEEWVQLRAELIDELRRLAREVEGRADFIPAARAISLCALLEVDQLERNRELSPRQRAELAQAVEDDCVRSMEILHLGGHVHATARTALAARACSTVPRPVGPRTVELREGPPRRRGRAAQRVHRTRAARFDRGRPRHGRRGRGGAAPGRTGRPARPEHHWPLARDWAARMFHADHAERALEFLVRNRPPAETPQTDLDEWSC